MPCGLEFLGILRYITGIEGGLTVSIPCMH